MKERTTAVAYPTIPVLLLGGLKNREKRIPFYTTMGLAVTDDRESVRTETVVSGGQGGQVEFFINGERLVKVPGTRSEDIFRAIDILRSRAGYHGGLRIYSNNYNIVTGSSDAGAAALVTAISDFFGLDIEKDELMEIGRFASESVYRSMVGGLSLTEVVGERCRARQVASEGDLRDFRIFAIPFEGERYSADTIHEKIVTHPQFWERVEGREEVVSRALRAVEKNDLVELMRIAEEDAMNFHYLLEWVGVRVIKDPMYEVTNCVREMRETGVQVYFTVAGGNMVYVYCTVRDEEEVGEKLKKYRALKYKVAGPPFIKYDI